MTEEVAVTQTDLPGTPTLNFISSGKVRDLYEIRDTETGNEYLLFVATDRISAYDVILKNGVPNKGRLLTQISAFWFDKLKHIIDNHVVASSLDTMPPGVRIQIEPYWERLLEGRTLLVKKAKVVKLEAIVRGYLTGSAWAEYKKTKTVHGIPQPDGLVESSKFPEPLFTPSTKAEQGEHDENISPDKARVLLGEDLYFHLSRLAIALYNAANEYALTRGLILADTKFEFGLVPIPQPPSSPPSSVTSPYPSFPPSPAPMPHSHSHPSSIKPSDISTIQPNKSITRESPSPIITFNGAPHALILIDEALTPDSSRYWYAESYQPGRPQASFDKQFLRDWLVSNGFRKGLESGPEGKEGQGWSMDEEVLRGTKERYALAVKMLMGESEVVN